MKTAWQEIVIEEKDPTDQKDPLKGNLLGGILESDKDLLAWAEHEIDLPPRRERQRKNFVKKFNGKRMAVIDDMRVFDRGKGWGTKIMQQFIEKAKAAGCDGIILQAGIFEDQQPGFDLVKWYQSLGFQTKGHSEDLPLMVKWLKPQGKNAGKEPTKNACVMIHLPEELAFKIRRLAEKVIDKADLAGDGFETEPHITIKYGVEEKLDGLIGVVHSQAPFEITIGKTHVFPPSKSSEGTAPVVLEVHAPELKKLHEQVGEVIGNRKDDFEYKSHCTLAYVKPEAAEKYDGLDFLDGVKFEVDNITLSRKDRIQNTVDFGLKQAAASNETHSLVLTADVEGFPSLVIVRYPQKGMRWRTVLKIIKQIAGQVAGKRVPWNAINIFESPWKDKEEQDSSWNQTVGKPMYDILEDGSFVATGQAPTPITAAQIEYAKGTPHRPERQMWGDDLECPCGNVVGWDGFYSCDREGNEVEPTEKDWDGVIVCCGRCGRIINVKNLRVVGYKDKVPRQPDFKFSAEKIKLTPYGDFEECICGNTPSEDGFYPVDREGNSFYDEKGEIRYDHPEGQDRHYYRCDRCGRIIDIANGLVVGISDEPELFNPFVTEGIKVSAEKIKGNPRPQMQHNWVYGKQWTCICGGHNFYPVDKDFNLVPAEGAWNESMRKLLLCGDCGRVVNYNTLEVVDSKSENLFGDMQASHKETPLSDTEFINPEIGEEMNAYADMPEKVRSDEKVPRLEELAPQMFKEAGERIKAYHGTDGDAPTEHNEVYFAQYPEDARDYGKNVFPAILTPRKILKPGDPNLEAILQAVFLDQKGLPLDHIVTKKGIRFRYFGDYPEIAAAMRKRGYDAAFVDEPMSMDAYSIVVVNPAVIQWQKPIKVGGAKFPTLEEAFRWGTNHDFWDADATTLSQVEWDDDWDDLDEEAQAEAARQAIQYKWNTDVLPVFKAHTFPLTLYRAVQAETIGGVNPNEPHHVWEWSPKGIGISWAYSESSEYIQEMSQSHLYYKGKKGVPKTIILRAVVTANAVDWPRTGYVNLCLPEEQEVALKVGAPINITGWKYAGETQWKKPRKELRTITANSPEGDNMPKHFQPPSVGLFKTPKDDPFWEEFELFGQKEAGLSNLDQMGLRIVEQAEVPGYEIYLVGAKDDPDWVELALQQTGQDASKIETQTQRVQPRTLPSEEIKNILMHWLTKYDKIHVMSHNPAYLQKYVRLLKRMRFTIGQEPELVEGLPAYFFTM